MHVAAVAYARIYAPTFVCSYAFQ